MKPNSLELGNNFDRAIQERSRPEVTGLRGVCLFWNQGDEILVNTLKINFTLVKIIYKLIEIFSNNIPTSFNKISIESIRSRCFVSRQGLDHLCICSSVKGSYKEERSSLLSIRLSQFNRLKVGTKVPSLCLNAL